MLDYIKKQISGRMNTTKPVEDVNDIPDETILEYAHIVPELKDLSVEGTDAGRERKMAIDIPLSEDIELETIEFNLDGGRVEDVPGDATAATVQEEYVGMKTYNDFYQETYDSTPRFARESDAMFSSRVAAITEEKYEAYCEYAIGKGLFGFDKINVGDEKVPSKINVDFGPIEKDSEKSFFTKVKTFFATDKEHNITKKQLDSVNLVRNGAFTNIGQPLMAYMESNYDVPTGSSVWDVCTPKNLIVPKGNNDSFCVVLEYTNEITGKNEFFGWTRPTTGSIEKITQESATIDSCVDLNMESFINEEQYENHDTYLQEAAVESQRPKRPLPSRFFQEAIDFGGGASEGDGGSDLPPVEGDTSDDTATSTDTGNDDVSVDTGNMSDAPESNDDSSDKEEAAVNDVSQEIAEKVAEKTQEDVNNDSSDSDAEITFDDDTTSMDTTSNDDTSAEATVDDQLDDLDNSMSDDTTDGTDDMSDDTSNGTDIDIDNMTIDQLIEQGSERLKGMTLQEIKQFINSGSPEAIQEAFILTKKNINKEIDVNLRKCLGVLNDNQMNLDKLLKTFKSVGSKFNRVLTKAVKIKDVYSTDEITSIKKLNKILVDLLTTLKHSKDASYVSVVKRLIREFVTQSKIVGSFVEEKLKGSTSETVQEGFVQEGFFLSEKNVKKRLANKIQPVFIDISSIVRAYKDGKLSKGKLSKMYKPKNASKKITLGSDNDIVKLSKSKDVNINTPEMNNIDSLAKIINKILRKKNVQVAFSSTELNQIEELCDTLDDFMDFVESIIYDNSGKESLLDLAGKDATKIVNILNEIYVSCTGEEPLKRNEVDNTDMDESFDNPIEDTSAPVDDLTDDTSELDDNSVDETDDNDLEDMSDTETDADDEGKDDE